MYFVSSCTDGLVSLSGVLTVPEFGKEQSSSTQYKLSEESSIVAGLSVSLVSANFRFLYSGVDVNFETVAMRQSVDASFVRFCTCTPEAPKYNTY